VGVAGARHARLEPARILLNLGTALNYASLHHDAIHSFAQATRLTNAWLVVSRARSNTALSHLYLGEYESGFACIRPLLDNPEHPGEEQENLRLPMMHSIALRLAVEMGDAQLARGIMEACVSYARASGAGRSVSIGHFAVGLFESRFGNVTHGIDVLERFVSSSAGEGSSYHAMGMSYLVRAYERAGLYDHALDLMRRLHSHTRQVRMKVLAMTPFYGQSPEEIRDLAAMQILESRLQAKASQQRADESRIEMFERLAVTADLKEEASGEHGYRVGRLSSLMAEELGWTKEACRAIDMAARLHDIGKIAMPDRILLTSEQLKEAERHIMSTHTLVGAELLAKSNIPQLQMAEEIAKFHHEWWNGEGYPAKRKEKRIPVHARIVALADVFDALTHGRPFAQPWPIDKALDEIRSRRGTQFDPELTDLFLELVARLRTEHENLDEYLGKAGRNSPFLQAREKIRLMLADPPTANSPKNASETVH
jgi:putative two-component system response regulator